MVGQGANARRRTAVHQARSESDSVQRGGGFAVDEIPAAAVDQRAVVMRCCDPKRCETGMPQLCRGVCLRTIIIVYHNTSLYIRTNEVDRSLGTNIAVYSGNIALVYS